MLGVEDPRRERLRRVVRRDWNGPLREDPPAVVNLVHHVHCDAADARAGGEHRLVDLAAVHPASTEGGEERRMDVQHPPSERGDDRGGEELEVPGEHHEFGAARGEEREDALGVLAVFADGGRDPAGARGALECAGVRPVRDDEDDGEPGLRFSVGVEQRLQVRSAARREDRDPEGRHAHRSVIV